MIFKRYRLFIFILFFLCCAFIPDCFAYDIKTYPGQPFPGQIQKCLKLVFYPRNYLNKDDFLKNVDLLIQRLKQTSPFKEVLDEIVFYYVDFKQEEKAIFKETHNFPPLEVREDFLDRLSSHLKSEYKLIIIDAAGSVSCAELSLADQTSLIILGKNRYKNTSSFSKGFLHELGHSLGLKDECVNCQQLSLSGPPNCAPTREEAEKLWGDLAGKDPRVDYISGCSGNKDYIRPTIASLMNNPDQAEDFGPVNERYLKKALEF